MKIGRERKREEKGKGSEDTCSGGMGWVLVKQNSMALGIVVFHYIAYFRPILSLTCNLEVFFPPKNIILNSVAKIE